MDFGSVLYKAQSNKECSKQAVNFYKTSFDPPKKEQREKKLSVNIQKFLARQEEEKRQKQLDEEKKKQELFALRNKDKKSNKRIQSMLKRTKSANKSVLEDAVDNVNTAITANGPLQPDEDDYGYVSKDASELYDRLVNRYTHESPQEKPKFPQSSTKSTADISSTKDRVKAALQREEEEKLLPRKRKRKSKNEGEDDDDDDKHSDEETTAESEKPEKSAADDSTIPKKDKFRIPKKNAGPPPIDFNSLLKLAAQKQHEPIIIEKKVEEKPDRPMTEKEKQEYMREKARILRKESPAAASKLMEALKKKQEANPKSKSLSKEKSMKTKDRLNATPLPTTSTLLKTDNLPKVSAENSSKLQPDVRTSKSSVESVIRPRTDIKLASLSSERVKLTDKIDSVHKQLPNKITSKEASSAFTKSKVASHETKLLPRTSDASYKEEKRKLLQAKPSSSVSTKVIKPSVDGGPSVKNTKVFERNRDTPIAARKIESNRPPKSETSVRQFPPPDVRRSEPRRELAASKSQLVRQFPPSDMIRKKKQPPVVRRHVIESDEEFDSEMDDFIDDSEECFDASKHIKEIFGYDRSRYSRYEEEDDDECMESNFSELQKEEYISTKLGILEDLDDIRKTKLEKERKKKRFR